VGDENKTHVALGLEGGKQIEDLRLDGYIERRGRLVRDQEPRSLAIAEAIMVRWRWPPESSCG